MSKELIVVFSYYGVGGAQRRAFNLADKFSKNGYKVTVLALKGADGSIKDDNYYNVSEDVSIVSIPDYYSENSGSPTANRIKEEYAKKIRLLKRICMLIPFIPSVKRIINDKIHALRNSEMLCTYLAEHRKSVIINFGFNIYETVYTASKGLGCKIIYAETNASDKYISDRNYENTKKLLKKADAYVFQTRDEMNSHDFKKEKCAVIHNPINGVLPQPYKGERRKVITNFCRMVPQKNLPLLINAFALFNKEYPDYELRIYADTSAQEAEYQKQLQALIESLAVTDSVKLLPSIRDIHQTVRDYEMFVCSSDYEGLSNSMIEAMAIGMPCICTDCGGGGARELIRDEENGLLVPVRDENALYQAMKRMAEDNALRLKCSENAAKVRQELSIEKIAGQWLEIIKETEK